MLNFLNIIYMYTPFKKQQIHSHSALKTEKRVKINYRYVKYFKFKNMEVGFKWISLRRCLYVTFHFCSFKFPNLNLFIDVLKETCHWLRDFLWLCDIIFLIAFILLMCKFTIKASSYLRHACSCDLLNSASWYWFIIKS